MITHASIRPGDRAGRGRWSGEVGLPARWSWHGLGSLAGVPIALLLALSALFVGGVAVAGPAAGAAVSAPAGSSTGTADPAWSQLGATASRTWSSAGLAVNFASSGNLSVSSRSSQSANWSLAPTGLGRGQIEPLQGGADTNGSATRTYDNGQLSMWYSATTTGLEQGFTLNRRPGGTSGAVTIAMKSAGGLTPELTSPTSLSLLGHRGQAELNYSGLKVTDASHKVLPAHLETSGSSIRIAFNDQGATYPIQVDPYLELASLVPPTTAEDFGTAIATSANGTVALVGDPYGGAKNTGAATVYTFANGSWSGGTALTLPQYPGEFGTSVALSGAGTTALVGDPYGGPPSSATGTATVYTFNGTSWSAGTALTDPDGADAYAFGTSVALSNDGSTALVGDPGGGSLGDSVNGSLGLGAATIFTGPSWSAVPLALPANSMTFGTSVALSSNGSTALVGDPNGGPPKHGIVTAFSGTSWGTENSLPAPGQARKFGTSVAISGSGTTALIGDPVGGGGTNPTGAATVETLTGSVWAASALLSPPSSPPNSLPAFGTSVSFNGAGTTALVGAPAGGANGTGTASIYTLSGTTWSSATPLSPAIGALTYGSSVALSNDGSTALVGDPTGGNSFGWVTIYTTNGSRWNLGTAATPPSGSYTFGSAVALSATGSTLLAGDPYGNGTGSASAYTYNGTSLSAGTALTRPASAGAFGTSLAVSSNGTTAIVGDPYDNFGAATVYTYNGTTSSQGTALTPPATAYSFGNSVAISASGTTAIVGDPGGGDAGTGAATVFTFATGTWDAGTPLTVPDTAALFGTSVALSGDGTTALVGDPTGGSGKGAVTAFTYSNGSWSGGTPLPTPAGSSAFGTSVALPYTGAAALVGDPTGGSGKGAVNVFSQNGGSWSNGTPLTAPSGSSAFGTSVAMSSSGVNAIVGDPQGTPQNQCLPGTGPGTATIYTFSGSAWSAGTHLTDPANSSAFGTSVALSGNGTTAAVGDPCGGFYENGGAAVFSFQTTLTPTTVTASANPAAQVAGSPVSYSATVAPQSGAGTPTGTVSFTAGPKTLCTATLASGSASCSASTAPVGTGRVYATYSGSSTYAGSVGSAPEAVTNQSTTSAMVNPTSTTAGSSVTYSATVASGSGSPTGTVIFTSGSTTLCASSIASGAASCGATNAPVGNDTITARYSGDPNFSTSSSATSLAVSPAPTPPPPPPPPPPSTSPSTSSGNGYWLVGSDGGIFSFGSAQFYGSTGSIKLQRPVVGIVPTRDDAGYWLDASDGGIFAFGDTQFYGSIPGLGLHPAGSGLPNSLDAPIVGMVPSNDDGGYFMVASDGGVFAFGDAYFAGSCPGIGGCSGAAVAVMPDASGNGYWLVTKTGTVYTFGDASYYGAPGNTGSPVTSAVRTPDGGGYWILTANGSVYSYGDAANYGDSAGAFGGFNPATAIFTTSDGGGYWIASAGGEVDNYGDAPNDGDMSGSNLNGLIIAATGF